MAEVSNDVVKIPRGIDDPPRLLVVRVDEALPILVGVLVGFMVGQLTLCAVVGVLVYRYQKRFNENAPDGTPLHVLYWLGYIKCKGWSFPNPFIRRFLP